MKKILVERVEEFTDNIKEYEVITQEEAIKMIDNFNIAESIVDGRYTIGDTTTTRSIYYKKPYYDFSPIDESIIEYDEFEEFRKQYQDWKNEIEREYDYEFDDRYYRDEYEAFIVEVLGENIDEFIRNYNIESMEAEIGSEIYEYTRKFYDEAKVIRELEE